MPAVNIEAERSDEGIRFRIPKGNIDAATLAACANAALACAEQNGCFDNGVALTEPCFNTLVAHDLLSGCMPSGLGFAQPTPERGATGELSVRARSLWAEVTDRQDVIELYLRGEGARAVDHELLRACMSVLAACAQDNGCLSEGLRVTTPCVTNFASHEAEIQCLSRGVGLSRS